MEKENVPMRRLWYAKLSLGTDFYNPNYKLMKSRVYSGKNDRALITAVL